MGYIFKLLSLHTMGSKIALGMYALVLLWALVCAWRGFRRGVSRQTIRLISIAGAAALAFFAAKSLYPTVMEFCSGKTVEELFASVGALQIYQKMGAEVQAILSAIDPESTSALLVMLVSMVITPLFFAVLFVIFSAFMELVHVCVSGMLGFIHRNNNFATRLLGAVLGALQGVVVVAILLVPAVGTVNFAKEAVARIEDPENKAEALYAEYVFDVAESPLVQTISTYGGDMLFSMLTEVKVDETTVNTRALANTVFDIYADVTVLNGADFKALSETQKAAISDIILTVGSDEYLAPIVAGILNTVGNNSDHFYAMMKNPDDTLSHVFAECLTVFATCDKDTLLADLTTIRDAYFLLSDSGALSVMSESSDAIADALAVTDSEGLTVAKRVISILEANDRTKPLVASITRITVSTLLQNSALDLGENTTEIYDALKSGIAEDVLTIVKDESAPEAYVTAVSEALGETFTASGITVAEESLNTMAEYISENYANLENVTDDEINDILISYYAAHIAQ